MSPSFLSNLWNGLTKTRDAIVGPIEALFSKKKAIDEETLEELEAVLIQSDLGIAATSAIIDSLRECGSRGERLDADGAVALIEQELVSILGANTVPLVKAGQPPTVVMVVGVNGTGKTTSIGKIASMLVREGNKVMLAAGDTFRAAAAEQLEVWGNRIGCNVIRHKEGSDPAAVAFDAYQSARARGFDYLLIDTAGRLHTKSNLMEELKKIKRVISRECDGAPHEVLLVVDATTGQNAIAQARVFNEAVGVTGVVLTKLDGTARGGIVVAISQELNIPVKYVGVGEGAEDLRPFNPDRFVQGILRIDGEAR
ncbi:MAG: signal recognition particle-docking protein FtsY [Firmicutes bacterium]|jgi:fused signal recognition particle receptor|nr:signal recognition particle-docking protein FtsY [Bacillota bacterium]MDD4336261.1 signal recognition particle-docking protein FtsY [Bacillota bacterium]MDD4791652.1 signal recognition particle-docking protein FtsY [Bacillota bacterium]